MLCLAEGRVPAVSTYHTYIAHACKHLHGDVEVAALATVTALGLVRVTIGHRRGSSGFLAVVVNELRTWCGCFRTCRRKICAGCISLTNAALVYFTLLARLIPSAFALLLFKQFVCWHLCKRTRVEGHRVPVLASSHTRR